MAFGPDGDLYVVARFGDNVLRYNGTNGSFLGEVVPAGQLTQPFGIKFGPAAEFYVASGNANKIARFANENGAYMGDFITSGAGGLSLPIDLAFGPNGDLFVASFNNNKVARFNGASGSYGGDFVTSASAGLNGPNFMVFRPARTYGTNIPGIGPVGPIEQRHLGLTFTEGPAADANGNVYFTDVQANRIYRSDTRGLLSVFLTNSRACNGLMFNQAGRLIACQRDERRIISTDVATTNITSVASNFAGRPFIGPNDLVVDSSGGAYFTDPNFGSGQSGPTQSVYYVSAAGQVSQIASNLSRPNGVILSVDEQTLYVVLSGAPRLMRYPIFGPGSVGAPSTNTLPGTGDGVTIDTAGNLYLCQPSLNSVLVLSSAGATLGSIPFPESPANCTFGGKDMKTLYVTARTSVYACQMNAVGHRFAWNSVSYADFQTKFFGTTNAPSSGLADDPDRDGAHNHLEYLARSHPLSGGDAWSITLRRTNSTAHVSFLQIAGRGFDVEQNSVAGLSGWSSLAVLGNPPVVVGTNRMVGMEDPIDAVTNRFYRVRIFEP
jgi:gluconolactonase